MNFILLENEYDLESDSSSDMSLLSTYALLQNANNNQLPDDLYSHTVRLQSTISDP